MRDYGTDPDEQLELDDLKEIFATAVIGGIFIVVLVYDAVSISLRILIRGVAISFRDIK